MNSNERYFYQQSIDRQMEVLLRKIRVAEAIREHDKKMYDQMIENEMDYEKEGAI